MSKENLNIKWIQIIITALITGLISLIVAIIVFNYTTEKSELIYEEFPVSSFENNNTNVCILNYAVKNIGNKTANDIEFLISLPETAIIKEPNIKLANSLTKFQIQQKEKNRVHFCVTSLYQYENFNISLLVENLTSDSKIRVELRSKECLGKRYSDTNESISPTLIYVLLVLAIALIILLLVIIFAARKAIKAMKFFRKELNKQADLEEQKIRNIIDQGVEYCDMGMVDDSIRVLLKGKYLHPESSSIHSNLARAYAKNGDFEKAEIEFKIAEKTMLDDSDKLIFHYTKAHYYALKNDKANMFIFLKKAQEYDKERVCEKMLIDEEFEKYHEDVDFMALKEVKN